LVGPLEERLGEELARRHGERDDPREAVGTMGTREVGRRRAPVVADQDALASARAFRDRHHGKVAELDAAALRDAIARGVKVRFLFETARDDKNLTDLAARAASKSGRIEADGIDVSEDRIAEGERTRAAIGMPGRFRVTDVNTSRLTPGAYDLIFSSHSFHHFLELEHIMGEVRSALAPGGLFVLEEFVGPTQFQWTDQQIDLVRSLMALLPEEYRMLRWNAVKPYEGRPTVADVVAASPFESIRSAEIVPLFRKHFEIVELRLLGGTLQHLLYNGIVHNFGSERAAAADYVRAIYETEDALIDRGLLPSDFMLLVGKRRD